MGQVQGYFPVAGGVFGRRASFAGADKGCGLSGLAEQRGKPAGCLRLLGAVVGESYVVPLPGLSPGLGQLSDLTVLAGDVGPNLGRQGAHPQPLVVASGGARAALGQRVGGRRWGGVRQPSAHGSRR
ncbi:MAG TPA: hypothetical protein VF690_14880 [Hymenobacter sp.]